MEDLDIRVLGSIHVSLGDVTLDLGGPKQRGLLARLLVSPGRVVSVDRLVDDLWGEEPPAGALSSLQAYISRLRRQLEPDAAARDRGRVLVTRAPGYQLVVDPGAIDAVRFERLIEDGRRALSEGGRAEARRLFEDALGLWRGTPFEEFAGEPFAVAEISRLVELHAALVEDHLALLVDADDPSAVARLEAAVAEHPVRERRWALLMVALYRQGRQADALRAFQRARSTLAESLGIEPGPALRDLDAKILAQSPDLALATEPTAIPLAPAAAATAHAADPGRSSGHDGDGGERQLVGRDAEVAALSALIDQADDGRGAVALVVGEPGIGKSALVMAAARSAQAQGRIVGVGGGVEGEQAPPFWPWTRVVRHLLAGRSEHWLRDRLGQALADLGHLDPVFAEWGGVALEPAMADPELARTRIFRAVIRALEVVAAEEVTVVVLDDLQWADGPSLQLLTLAAHELTDAGVVILGAFRAEEGSAALADARAALARLDRTVQIDLRGLSAAAIPELVESAVGRSVGDDVASALLDRTSGNPLFVTELARMLQAEADLDATSARQAPIPAGVRDVIDRRLARLPEQTRTLLHLGAVIGRTFELSLLEAVTEVAADDLLDQVEVAVALGVIEEGTGAVGDYTFGHDLVRDALYQSLSATRRARLHTRVADALQGGAVADRPGRPFEVARHLEAAQAVLPAVRVVDGLIDAADAAAVQLDMDRAGALLDRALTRLPAIDAADRAQREVRIRLRLGNLLTLARGYASPETGEQFERAASLLGSLPPGPERLHARWGVAVFTGVGGRFTDVLALGRAGLDEARTASDPAGAAAFHQILGTFSWHVAAFADADHHLAEAVRWQDEHHLDLRAITLHDVAVAARSFHALVAWAQGRDEQADELIADALARAEALDDDFSRVVAMFFQAWLFALRGDRDRTLELAGPVIGIADARGFSQYGPMARVLAAWAAGSEEAIDGLAAGLAGAAETGARMLGHFFLTLYGDACLRLGRIDEAEQTLLAAVGESDATGERFFAPESLRLLGAVAEAGGDSAAAADWYRRALELAVSLGHEALRQRIEASASVVDEV